jgi:hypothetical protein
VDLYLPYFRQWLITGPLLALLPFQPLFTEIRMEISSLLLPLLRYAYSTSPCLLCVSFQFLVYSVFWCFFFWGGVVEG